MYMFVRYTDLKRKKDVCMYHAYSLGKCYACVVCEGMHIQQCVCVCVRERSVYSSICVCM